jgi:hypothetical protein
MSEPDLHRETIEAIYALYEARPRGKPLMWVMSPEWHREIRRAVDPHGAWVAAVAPQLPETLLGIPVEIRDEAGFPKLEPLEDA